MAADTGASAGRRATVETVDRGAAPPGRRDRRRRTRYVRGGDPCGGWLVTVHAGDRGD